MNKVLGLIVFLTVILFTRTCNSDDAASFMSSLKIKNNDVLQSCLSSVGIGLKAFSEDNYLEAGLKFKNVLDKKWSVERGAVGPFAGYGWCICVNKLMETKDVSDLMKEGIALEDLKPIIDLYSGSNSGFKMFLADIQNKAADEGNNQTFLGNIHDGDFLVYKEVLEKIDKYCCAVEYGTDGKIHVRVWKKPGKFQKLLWKILGMN